MKRGKSGVAIAVILVAAMLLMFALVACEKDDGCEHVNMRYVAAIDATCVEDGNVEFWYCPDCGKYYSDEMGEHAISIDDTVIAATGEHDWGAWVTDSESSCTTGGTRHRICNDCGERQEETLPVDKHDLNFVKAVEATCTEEGNVAHWHCSECGKNYSDEEATEVLNDATTPKAAHDTTFVEAQAHTCTDDGNIAYWHCGACGHNFADEDGEQELESVVDPAAHAWGEWEQTSDPTCTKRGVLTRVCEVCFDEEYDYIDELGHDFENAQWAHNDANHWHLCNRCGAASQRELHEYDAEGVCVCGMIEYAPTSEFRFISLGGDTWRLANYTGTRRNVSIPSTYNGGTVVAISDNAFAGNTSMETLVIPETVTSIGAEAFADCANLKNLTMSSKVTTIGDNAFDGCDAIETASIPANAASYISKGNLVDLTVTNGAIEEYAFASSPKLVSVKVVGETTAIGREAFSGCAVLASVEVDGQEVAIGDNAFVDCAMLTDVTFGDVASIGDFAFKDCAAIGEVVIPDSVTSIGGGAFSGCSGLTSMRLPFVGGSEQVTPSESTLFGYIFGTESFANSFETVQLYGIEEGQSVAYYIPRNLSTVSVGGDIGFGAFYGCDRLVDVTIEWASTIGDQAFYNNASLENISLPSILRSIGDSAFAYCAALPSIAIPNGVTHIGNSAFYRCGEWESILLPFIGENESGSGDGRFISIFGQVPSSLNEVIVTGSSSINAKAFEDCYFLEKITLPESITELGDNLFDDCTGLESLIYQGPMAQWDLNVKNSVGNEDVVVECEDGTFVTCYISYDLDGGENNSGNINGYYTVVDLGGADGSMPLADPNKKGEILSYTSNGDGSFEVTQNVYTFLGWYKDPSFEQKVTALTLDLGDVTLYAKWSDPTSQTSTVQVYTREGDYIYFGEYPQTLKADDVTVGDVADEDGYYLGSDGERYAKVIADPYGWDYTFSDGSSVTDGATYYFKVEPIRWRILSEDGESAFILADGIIANRQYDPSYNDYADSEIRAWLNDEFLNAAFGEVAQSLIETTEVDNSAYSTGSSSNPYACENTFDKVFLLSWREVVNSAYGFASSASTDDTARRMTVSDYARSTGAHMDTSSSYFGCGVWRLRSPESGLSYGAWVVIASGASSLGNVGRDHHGIVPALNIIL